MTPTASKYCSYTLEQLDELMEQLKFLDDKHMRSHDYMMAFKQQMVVMNERKIAYLEYERRLEECERSRALYDKKLIPLKDMAPDRCLHDQHVVPTSFSDMKKSLRRCASPEREETVLDAATRYHRSEFLDPFGVLGLEYATPVNQSEQRDEIVVDALYRRTYDDPHLQALAGSETVEELFRHADDALSKTTDGCKS